MLPPVSTTHHVAIAEALGMLDERGEAGRARAFDDGLLDLGRRARPRPRCAARETTSRSSTSAPTISRVSVPDGSVTAMPSAIVGSACGAGPRPSACDHAGVALDLDADDLDVGAPALGRDRDAGR